MTKKKKEGDISVTINFGSLDGDIYNYLNKLPSRTIRSWEIKKLAMIQYEGKATAISDPVPKQKSELDASSGDKNGSRIMDF